MAGYGRKKTFKEKMTDLKGSLRRAFIMAAVIGTPIAGVGYYNYGTIHEAEVKVKDVKSEWVEYDSKKGESIYQYKIVLDNGKVLQNKNTTLHAKFNSKDIQDMLNDGRNSSSSWGYDENGRYTQQKIDPATDPKNKVWHIRYYGARIDIPFIHTMPNILSAREVTQDELKARAEAQEAARQARQQGQQGQQGQQQGQQGVVPPGQQQNGTVTTPAQPAALSGTMLTFETVVNGQRIELTVPIEAAGKVTVNKVTPLVPPAPRGPGG